MKAYIRPILVVLAIVLIALSVRRGMNGGNVDYFSVGLAVATLILIAFMSLQKPDDD